MAYIRYPNPDDLTIGTVISGGLPNAVLYIDASGNLAQTAGFTFASNVLSVPGPSGRVEFSLGDGVVRTMSSGAGILLSAAASTSSGTGGGQVEIRAGNGFGGSIPGTIYLTTFGGQLSLDGLTGALNLPAVLSIAANGSVTAPVLGWSADPDTGIYRVANGQVSLALNGSTSNWSQGRQVNFQDLNTVYGSSLGTGIIQNSKDSIIANGVEGTLPLGQIHTVGGTGVTNAVVYVEQISNTNPGQGGGLTLARAGGTSPTAKTAVLSGFILGALNFSGNRTSSAVASGARFQASATENWTPNFGTDLVLATNLTGATSRTDYIRFGGDGKMTFLRASGNDIAWNTDGGGSIGAVSANRPANIYATTRIAGGSLGVGNSAAATTPGTVVRKIEIFNQSGTSLGFIPVYDTIT
jgi:hypothetical protein